jgi:hypothetical protein
VGQMITEAIQSSRPHSTIHCQHTTHLWSRVCHCATIL